MQYKLPLGQQLHAVLNTRGHEAASDWARERGEFELLHRVSAVAGEDPEPGFLHSALCAMSLPVRRPADDTQPIIRQDGQYTLVITPRPILDRVDGRNGMRVLGVPYGSLPRLILIHIMSKAVRSRSRHVVLGATFTEWMRMMGFQTISYGPRGSATLIRQQLDRLLACEWMIRWENLHPDNTREYGIKEVKLTNEYAALDGKGGVFTREIYLSEGFFEHLRQHAVPLNEHAIRQLRDSATALDLYTWLAYRLPRIGGKRPATLSWEQLAVHFGNEGGTIRKFRQTVRDAWERQVSGVYPEARAEFDTSVIRLYPSPPPVQQRLVPGAHLTLLEGQGGDKEVAAPVPVPSADPKPAGPAAAGMRFMASIEAQLGAVEARAWFGDARLEPPAEEGEGWRLITSTSFKASWIRSRLAHVLAQAAETAGLSGTPAVTTRAGSAPS